MPTFETLDFSINDGLATITFNRPDRLNALSAKLKSEFLLALRSLNRQDSDARALLITGAGRGFCAGADLAEGGNENRDMGASLTDTYHPFLTELANLRIPVVSAVNGVAAGAGMSIAISADIVIAAKSAYFLQAFVNIGLVPDAGSTFLLPRLVGLNRARSMMMLGEKVPADKALDWGLVYDVVEDDALLDTATKLATKLANGPTVALGSIRHLLAQSLTNDYQGQLAAEATAQRVAGRTEDCVEGVMAFIQKREAAFKGK
ncbi:MULTISPECIES: enoyl-CoA hydratase-related protein [Kordiimonas]|jgi:2-(1,2-epoxy-1,2-dihydrophenyl)acetyl-CoA isomerase|uniref:enoyl-CoA hydratase-related protein n=1 Tax=Kordiimonas TaxID=288021 RepID=UPI00257BA7ED|nr:enoyl-CoA hydratase-related protein [Kordiimonas sp. UBA4487]